MAQPSLAESPARASNDVRRSRRLSPRRSKQPGSRPWVGVGFVAPMVIILVALVVFPTLASFCYSFTDATVGGSAHFVGVQNYLVLFGDPAFLSALSNLVLIIGVSLAIKFILGLTLATLLCRPMRAQRFWRAIVILPWAIPPFVAFMGWTLMFNGQTGALDQVLGWFGLHIEFLATPGWARASVVLATVWAGFPFWVIGILAAMQTIPRERYDAAAVDGASIWQQFRFITLPAIRPTVSVVAVLSAMWTTNGFENIWLLTQGGPSNATMTFPVLSYLDLTNFQLGSASAAAMITLPLFIAIIFWLNRSGEKE